MSAPTFKMTEQKIRQFNMMLAVLKRIAKEYMTPEQLRKNSEKKFGLEFEECIEMTYENIQCDAKNAIHNVRPIELPKPPQP